MPKFYVGIMYRSLFEYHRQSQPLRSGFEISTPIPFSSRETFTLSLPPQQIIRSDDNKVTLH